MKKIIELCFNVFDHEDSDLVVIEGSNNDIPFEIKRIFSVRSLTKTVRGKHAHKECTQVLTCPHGEIEVLCFDGKKEQAFKLDKPYKGLLIQPGIWAEQRYIKDNSILTVICDSFYDENEYIRDKEEFLKFKKLGV